MGILDQITGLVAPAMGGLRKPLQATQMPFKTHVGITHGDAAYDTMAQVLAIVGALAAGSVWTKIWELTVPAQQRIRWGFGSPATPHNQGYMWFCSLDSGTGFETGMLRLIQTNARETNVKTVLEVDDTQLHLAVNTNLGLATPININEKMALPEKVEFPKVGEVMV